MKACSTVADDIAEPFLNDFHAKNLNLNERRTESFNQHSVPAQKKIENLKNVNFQINRVEPSDESRRFYAKNLEIQTQNSDIPMNLQRNIFYSDNPSENLRDIFKLLEKFTHIQSIFNQRIKIVNKI